MAVEPHAEVAALVSRSRALAVAMAVGVVALLAISVIPVGSVPSVTSPSGSRFMGSGPSRASSPSSYSPLKANVTGPKVVGQNKTFEYVLMAHGGPAYAANGTEVGNITYWASVAGTNTTSVSFLPSTGTVPNSTSGYPVELDTSGIVQTLTITVEFASLYEKLNESLNVTITVHVVAPYILTGKVVAGAQTVLSFAIPVTLDGTIVGAITIPTLTPKEVYNFTFDYTTLPLGPGYHTFVLTLPSPHGQVHFANGQQSYSITFYVEGPSANYTDYYVLGVVAFVAVVLISLLYVGSRRPGAPR